MKKYKFLLFDLDNTLLDFEADMAIALELAYNASGLGSILPYSKDLLTDYAKCNKLWWDNFERKLCDKDRLYVARFEDFLAMHKLDFDPAALNKLYFDCLEETGTAYEGAVELLSELSKDHELYIVTNGYLGTQPSRLRRSGMDAFYKRCFTSEEMGAAKPSHDYFKAVFQLIKDFEPEKAILIGDSLFADIRGAANAGIDSIWYNPGNLRPSEMLFTYEANSFEDISRILN